MTDGQEPTDGQRGSRRWRIAATLAVLVALGALGTLGFLLLRAGSSSASKDVMACVPDRDFTSDAKPKCPPKGAPHEDGLVQEATDTGFELITIDGNKRSFVVRPADRPYIDVQHAQTHASLGQPIRVYTKRVNGEDAIIYMVDSPLRFR